MKLFLRPMTRQLLERLQEPPRFMQIVMGPRQVGKTTAIDQAIRALRRKGFASVFASADAVASPPTDWIAKHWNDARALARKGKQVLLAFDELQKIPGWSEVVKREFDADRSSESMSRVRVAISGSSVLMIEKGLTESLAGRFELIRFPHWSLDEQASIGADLERYVALGGYPRLRDFPSEPERFLQYVRDSIIEPVLNKDILLLHPVEKPVLLRRLFEFACCHPAEIVSLQKMLGQLTDKGNVTTIANYLDLLGKAFLIAPIQKYSPEILRIRSSSPKLIVMAQALVAATQGKIPSDLRKDRELYGRWAENAVGAHLIKRGLEVFYWRERDEEIDFVVRHRGVIMAVEVTVSGRKRAAAPLERLAKKQGIPNTLLIGPGGIDLAKFLESDPRACFQNAPLR